MAPREQNSGQNEAYQKVQMLSSVDPKVEDPYKMIDSESVSEAYNLEAGLQETDKDDPECAQTHSICVTPNVTKY